MSAMHDRLTNGHGLPDWRPAVTAATPMQMPAFALDMTQRPAVSDLYYEAALPVITTDGAVIPGRSGIEPPNVMPAGRP